MKRRNQKNFPMLEEVNLARGKNIFIAYYSVVNTEHRRRLI